MTEPSSSSNLRRRLRSSLFPAGGLALAAVLLLLAPSAAAAPGLPGWTNATPESWTNGLVLCDFAATSPTVAVSALAREGSGLTLLPTSFVELRSNGSVAAVANVTAVVWAVANRSTDDAYDLHYSAHVELTAPTPSTTPVGSADLAVDFVLPAYHDSPAGATDQVAVNLTVSNWTWQATGDALEIGFGAWPTYAGSETLLPAASDGWLLTSRSNATGADFEQFGVASEAEAEPAQGPATNVTATARATVSDTFASISVAFAAAGEFRALAFTAHVGVILPATIAGIPTYEFVLVVAAGAVTTVALAGLVRHVRRRPSNLAYVDEEP